MGLIAGLDAVEQKYSAPLRIESLFLGHPARSLGAIPTERREKSYFYKERNPVLQPLASHYITDGNNKYNFGVTSCGPQFRSGSMKTHQVADNAA